MSRSVNTNNANLQVITELPPKTRRGNGEGTIYQRSNGTWMAQVLLGYKPDGKPIRKSFSGKTRKEVAAKLSSVATMVFQGTDLTQASAMNVEDFAAYWISIKRLEITSRTLAWYRNSLDVHVLPALGPFPLADVNAVHIQSIINNMALQGGYAHRTIKGIRNLISQMLKFACLQKLIQSNPAELVVIPKQRRAVGTEHDKAIPIELRTAVLQAAEGNPIMKPIITTALFSGLRPSELLALTWGSIDMQNRRITVNQALTLEYDYDRKGNVLGRHSQVGPPKTNAGYRKVVVPQAVIDVLKEWQAYLTTFPKGPELLEAKSPVFCNTQNGSYRTYNGFRTTYRRFLEQHGLDSDRLNLHRYRHTYATTLLEMNINPRIVQKLLGHEDISTTLGTYSHVVSEVYESVAAGLDSTYGQLLAGTYSPSMGKNE